jgi:hypothetical protein
MELSTIKHYAQYLTLFITSVVISMWGQFFTLKFPNMSMIESFAKAIPFAWADWLFMSWAINIGDKYKLVTPTQDTFLLIISQFTLILIINKFYLKQPVTRSDLVAFALIIFAYFISAKRIVSNTILKKKTQREKPPTEKVGSSTKK